MVMPAEAAFSWTPSEGVIAYDVETSLAAS